MADPSASAPIPDVSLIEGADDARIADFLAQKLQADLAAGAGRVRLCLPGGATPFPILRLLAQHPLDWRRVEIWPGDDRLVPEAHEASNTGKLRALFAPTGAQVHALADAPASAIERFDLVWLGMGGDGHVASLFPSSDPQAGDREKVRRLIPDPLPPEAPFARITLTIPALLDTRMLMFVIRGAEKRALFEAAARGANDLPIARLLAAAQGRVDRKVCFA